MEIGLMSPPLSWTIAAVLSYLIGGIPFGVFVARFVRGVDIRSLGSGNTGATNVGRTIGKKWGLLVLVLDALKGALPVAVFAPLFLPEEQVLHGRVLFGICAVFGHMYSPWLRFSGGKGMATATGVVAVVAPPATLAAFAAFCLIVLPTRLVALGSIVASLTFCIWEMCVLRPHPFSTENWSMGLFSIVVPVLIIWRHRSNIARLLNGTEPAFTTPVDDAESVDGKPASEPVN